MAPKKRKPLLDSEPEAKSKEMKSRTLKHFSLKGKKSKVTSSSKVSNAKSRSSPSKGKTLEDFTPPVNSPSMKVPRPRPPSKDTKSRTPNRSSQKTKSVSKVTSSSKVSNAKSRSPRSNDKVSKAVNSPLKSPNKEVPRSEPKETKSRTPTHSPVKMKSVSKVASPASKRSKVASSPNAKSRSPSDGKVSKSVSSPSKKVRRPEPDSDSCYADSDVEKKCPVPGCDSKGHFSGKFDYHFSAVTCPLYHNLTPEDCVERYQRRMRKPIQSLNIQSLNIQSLNIQSLNIQSLKTPTKVGSKPSPNKTPGRNSPRTPLSKVSKVASPVKASGRVSKVASPKSGSKKNDLDGRWQKLNEKRKKEMATILSNSPTRSSRPIGTSNTSREPELKGLTPIFDYEMFREAQSKAAGKLQEQLNEHAHSENADSGRSYHRGGSSISNLRSIILGKYEMDVWYTSPYPDEFLILPKIFICEFCLKYFNSPLIMQRHVVKCLYR